MGPLVSAQHQAKRWPAQQIKSLHATMVASHEWSGPIDQHAPLPMLYIWYSPFCWLHCLGLLKLLPSGQAVPIAPGNFKGSICCNIHTHSCIVLSTLSHHHTCQFATPTRTRQHHRHVTEVPAGRPAYLPRTAGRPLQARLPVIYILHTPPGNSHHSLWTPLLPQAMWRAAYTAIHTHTHSCIILSTLLRHHTCQVPHSLKLCSTTGTSQWFLPAGRLAQDCSDLTGSAASYVHTAHSFKILTPQPGDPHQRPSNGEGQT